MNIAYVGNLLLTYFFAMLLSGIIFTFLTVRGRYIKKFLSLLFITIPLVLLFYWGNEIDSSNYKWWLIGIVIWNLIAQARHINKRIKMSKYENM